MPWRTWASSYAGADVGAFVAVIGDDPCVIADVGAFVAYVVGADVGAFVTSLALT